MPDTLPRARWRPIVDECLASGLPVSRWSGEHGIDSSRMYHWIARFREEEAQLASDARWVYLACGSFERMPNIDIKDPAAIDELLPFSPSLPNACRTGR
jgi:hypothetical protein